MALADKRSGKLNAERGRCIARLNQTFFDIKKAPQRLQDERLVRHSIRTCIQRQAKWPYPRKASL